MKSSTALFVLTLIGSAAPGRPDALRAQARPETIRGRVTTDSGAVMAAATVIATMAPDRTVFRTVTDAKGMYQLDIPAGTGDYLVYITAVGRTAYRKRITRTGNAADFVVDAKLAPDVTAVAAVAVRATRLTPTRGIDADPDNPGDRDLDGVDAAVSPDEQGNLAAMVGMIPGLLRSGDGFSALGLPSSQNAITLNGMAFPGMDIPRDSRVYMRVSTTPFDPALGWFSGAALDVRPTGPGLYSFRRARLSFDGASSGVPGAAPALAATYSASGRVDHANRFAYSLSAQARRQSPSAPSLFDSPASVKRDLGIDADSLARLGGILEQLGLGAALATPTRSVVESGSVLFRIEKNPMRGATAVPTAYGIDLYARGMRSGGLGVTPTAAGSAAWTSGQRSGAFNAFLSHYATPDFLIDARSSVSTNGTQRSPYNSVPAGRVFLSSNRFSFGGAGGRSESNQLTVDNSVEGRFYIPGNYTHRLKVTGRARYDAQQSERASLGAFTFASLDDLAADRPESFTRAIDPAPASAGVVNAFLAASDFWRPRPNLQINYGVRLEGAAFTSDLDRRPDLEQAFGVNSTRLPGSVHLSPRVGFSWRRGRPNGLYRTNDLGAFRLAAANVLRGGFGEFRNITSPSPMLDALSASRLGASLTCIDAAAPTPDWSGYQDDAASIPSSCANAGPPAYRDGIGAAHVFAAGFVPTRSWRGNLAYTMRPLGVAMTLDATASYNLDQPGVIDRNLGAAQFQTSDEGRTVFAPASSIVTSSGLIPGSASRVNPAFGRVLEHRSELRSLTHQYTVTVMPRPLSPDFVTRVAYTFRRSTESGRGFDRTTFGDPLARAWSDGASPSHQIQTQLGITRNGFSASAVGRATSGSRYTPIVANDVNGDGLTNDRAFIFGSGASGDAALDASLDAVIRDAPARTRDCLSARRGGPAAQNQCEGPWSFRLDGMARIIRPELRRKRVASIDIGLTNLLGLLDASLHGSRVRGWGQASIPDPVLYHVRGFDAATRRYVYDVNPAFGRERAALGRLASPFRLSLEVSFDIGTPIARQQFNNWVLTGRGGKPGNRLTQAELRSRYAGQVPDIYQTVLAETDSLLLSRRQVDSLSAMRQVYRARVDSIWIRLTADLVALGDDFDQNGAFARQEIAIAEAWKHNWQAVRDMSPVLSDVQRSLLGGWFLAVSRMKAPGVPRSMR